MTTAINNGAVECGGAQVRAYCHHVATVVTIRGEIDAVNVDRLADYVGHFISEKDRVVLDLSDVTQFSTAGTSLLYAVDDECSAAGAEWTLVPSAAVIDQLSGGKDWALLPIARSVHEALRSLTDAIARRRRCMLTLIKKTA
ncbi:STAS domain-containing protein [Mycobacterium sp. 1423905.2]|uniref:STAS domain-containing protein n=1 Tax=Mycobacterium sp. 1423905.2 TaxID=1856859 RepID=UPI000800DDBE|nr:STAS domain-containing protein [Mycobacterium sp. 1423905.2]OBJ48174.1 sulfate transporter [Mycobacterium sp. 1423905.2]